jgi:hypothetical protein
MIPDVETEEAVSNQAHADVTTYQTFVTTVEDVVRHVVKKDIHTTRTTKRILMFV